MVDGDRGCDGAPFIPKTNAAAQSDERRGVGAKVTVTCGCGRHTHNWKVEFVWKLCVGKLDP